jgi:hypothetical protein
MDEVKLSFLLKDYRLIAERRSAPAMTRRAMLVEA